MVTSSVKSVLVPGAVALVVGAVVLPQQRPGGAAPTRPPSQEARGMAFVNSQTIIQQMPGYAAADSTLKRELQGYQDEIQKLQAQLDSMQTAYDRQELVLSPSVRQQKQQEMRQLDQRVRQRYAELNTNAQRRERELVEPFETRVRGVIDGLRAERNLAIIFDVASPGNGIVAADRSLDLTAVVVQRLRGSQ